MIVKKMKPNLAIWGWISNWVIEYDSRNNYQNLGLIFLADEIKVNLKSKFYHIRYKHGKIRNKRILKTYPVI